MHQLKTALYAVLAFAAATSISIGNGGALLIQLPPVASLVSHPDLYAAGLLVLVEIFGRLTPSPANSTISGLLARLLDAVLPNRATDGGRFTTQSVLTHGPIN